MVSPVTSPSPVLRVARDLKPAQATTTPSPCFPSKLSPFSPHERPGDRPGRYGNCLPLTDLSGGKGSQQGGPSSVHLEVINLRERESAAGSAYTRFPVFKTQGRALGKASDERF